MFFDCFHQQNSRLVHDLACKITDFSHISQDVVVVVAAVWLIDINSPLKFHGTVVSGSAMLGCEPDVLLKRTGIPLDLFLS